MVINLEGDPYYYGYVPYVSIPRFSRLQNEGKCQATALLNVTFEKPQPYLYGCVMEPECGRRMLQVDLYLSNDKKDWVFNIGDSKSNSGTGNLLACFKLDFKS